MVGQAEIKLQQLLLCGGDLYIPNPVGFDLYFQPLGDAKEETRQQVDALRFVADGVELRVNFFNVRQLQGLEVQTFLLYFRLALNNVI